MSFLKKDGFLLVNRQEINPTTVTSGRMSYPENIYDLISEKHPNTRVVDGLGLAKKAGNVRAVNSVLVGAASRHMDIPDEIWKRVITRRLPEKFVSLNLRAFDLGRTP